MKKIAVLFLLMGLALPAYASKQEKAEELMRITNSTQTMGVALESFIDIFRCPYVLSQKDEEEIKKDLIEALGINELQKSLVSFWVDHYTEEELDEVLKFHKTGAGKKMMELMPEYMSFVMEKSHNLDTSKVSNVMESFSKKLPQRPKEEAEACLKKTLMK